MLTAIAPILHKVHLLLMQAMIAFPLIFNTNTNRSGWSIEPGIRYSATKANLRKFYENNSDASTMFAPEEKRYEETYSLRVTKQVSKDLFIFSGLSQGFRPPSLSLQPH